MEAIRLSNTSEGLGFFGGSSNGSAAAGAFSAIGDIGGSLIGGIFGNKIAKINNDALKFQEGTKRELSKDNISISRIQAETQKLLQQADFEKSKLASFNNQLSLKLQQDKDTAKSENLKYGIAAALVAVLAVTGAIMYNTKKRK